MTIRRKKKTETEEAGAPPHAGVPACVIGVHEVLNKVHEHAVKPWWDDDGVVPAKARRWPERLSALVGTEMDRPRAGTLLGHLNEESLWGPPRRAADYLGLIPRHLSRGAPGVPDIDEVPEADMGVTCTAARLRALCLIAHLRERIEALEKAALPSIDFVRELPHHSVEVCVTLAGATRAAKLTDSELLGWLAERGFVEGRRKDKGNLVRKIPELAAHIRPIRRRLAGDPDRNACYALDAAVRRQVRRQPSR